MERMSAARLLLTGLLSLGTVAPVLAAGSTLASGQYETLMLAVTPEHTVEGYYVEEMGVGVTRSCAFFLQGRLGTAARTPVTTWSGPVLSGSVTPTGDGLTLVVERGTEHLGCMSVMAPDIDTGLDLSRTASKPWIGLLMVSADKAYLQKTAGGQAAKGPYIVSGNVVAVLAYKDGSAQVEYINANGTSFTGWIRQDQYRYLKAP
ncbi:MAG: hypothetical protein GAK31_01530 [Stenotrophomonas maltophilia]|uniref:SH3 domain-containing protein n=1 Tax=Stenotrophomonas maltophilia TaxID=40324 RepID=A0A7V8JMH7_STEMA|nr:MAG: hypothetical protein GAK31_01530 [Stenotrophomonas maltophilia]